MHSTNNNGYIQDSPQQLSANLNAQNPQDLLYKTPSLVQQHISNNLIQNTQQKQEVDFLRPVADPRSPVYSSHYEPQPILPYQQFPAQQQTWVPHQSNQMPQQLPSYGGTYNFHFVL